jgi:hypothetical protein
VSEGSAARVDEFVQAFNARDVEAIVAICHPDCEVIALRSEIEGPFRGHDGVRRWFGGFVETAADVSLVAERVETLSDGRMVLLGRQSGSGTMGAVGFDAPLAAIVSYEDGLVKHVRSFPTHEAALQAAGLDS